MAGDRTFSTDLPDWFPPSGDAGRTTFGTHGELPKHDDRLVAYGECAEANAALGVAIAVGQLPVEINALLTSIQNDMLDLSADIFVPMRSTQPVEARLSDTYLHRLERAVLHYAQGVSEPDTRVLPGGTAAAALLYLARHVVRRAERAVWHAVDTYPDDTNPVAARYLNRLSTLLLLLARGANEEHGNIDWAPGATGRAMQEDDAR